jgi:hypothetical protein
MREDSLVQLTSPDRTTGKQNVAGSDTVNPKVSRIYPVSHRSSDSSYADCDYQETQIRFSD